MEMPQPVAKPSQPEKNPLQKRIAEVKANRGLRNAFEALGTAGELQAKFDSTLKTLDAMIDDRNREIKDFASVQMEELSQVIDALAVEKDARRIDEYVKQAQGIISRVERQVEHTANREAEARDESWRKGHRGEGGNAALQRIHNENIRAQGGPS